MLRLQGKFDTDHSGSESQCVYMLDRALAWTNFAAQLADSTIHLLSWNTVAWQRDRNSFAQQSHPSSHTVSKICQENLGFAFRQIVRHTEKNRALFLLYNSDFSTFSISPLSSLIFIRDPTQGLSGCQGPQRITELPSSIPFSQDAPQFASHHWPFRPRAQVKFKAETELDRKSHSRWALNASPAVPENMSTWSAPLSGSNEKAR